MKTLSRVLAICLCSVPFFGMGAWGVVATTSGHNLTAYSPSNANNNQWATAVNGRQEVSAPSAKADFGNCNALISRCAQPKCANGGCADINIATSIVVGCVKSNKTCEQYGNELISSMAAQLVAASTAKINAQNVAAAQSAAVTQNAQTQQQMQEMQQQMQSQLSQMQIQMQQQNAQNQQQLQMALQQQQEQNAIMLQNMQAAANAAADAAANASASVNVASASVSQVSGDMSTGVGQTTGVGLTGYQMDAVERGASLRALERQEIGNQVMAEMKNADTALNAVKTAMNNSFEYAGCDSHGNNCTGPKRVKKWRELAMGFIDPYDMVVDKLYDAIETAMFVGGIDLSDIYMMLDDSCQKWGEFMCEPGRVEYNSKISTDGSESKKGTPYSCKNRGEGDNAVGFDACIRDRCEKSVFTDMQTCRDACFKTHCTQCKPLKAISDKSEVYTRWVQSDTEDLTSNTTVVACMDNVMTNNKLFGRRTKRRKGSDLFDLEVISSWLTQIEPVSAKETKSAETDERLKYCSAGDEPSKEILRKASLARAVQGNLCVWSLGGSDTPNDDECPYINKVYAICDTHVYNNGKVEPSKTQSERDEVKEIIGLKVTVLSQQLYKQYEYLAATLRRLQTQLKKSVFSANLEVAGANSDGSNGYGSASDEDKAIHLPGAENCWNASSPDKAYECMINNINLIKANINTNAQKAGKQLAQTVAVAKQWEIYTCKQDKDGNCDESKDPCRNYTSSKHSSNKKDITDCANNLQVAIVREKANTENNKNRYQQRMW